MAVKKSTTTTTTVTTVPDFTILINCMKPCTPCDALVKNALGTKFKTWAKDNGYTVVYNDNNSKMLAYWKTYGKPAKINQTTPQLYIIKANQECKGIFLDAGVKINDYEVPTYDKWNAAMMIEICKIFI